MIYTFGKMTNKQCIILHRQVAIVDVILSMHKLLFPAKLNIRRINLYNKYQNDRVCYNETVGFHNISLV